MCHIYKHYKGTLDGTSKLNIPGEDYDFISDVGDWFKENLSIDELSDNLSDIYNKVSRQNNEPIERNLL